MSTTNNDVAKNFVLQTGTHIHNQTHSLSYRDNILFSYSTALARVDTDRRTVLLSDTNMTQTTSKHRLEVVSSAIDNDYKVLPIPLERGTSNFPTDEQIVQRFETRMDYLTRGTELALSDNRREFLNSYENYKEFLKYANITSEKRKKYDEINENLNNTEFIKELQTKRRKFQRELTPYKKAEILSEMDIN